MKDEESMDQLAEVMEQLVSDLRQMKQQIAAMRRYLRDEGYGDDDPPGPEDLDDD